MGGYSNDELHYRQHTGDVGNAMLGDFRGGGRGRKREAFRLPVALIYVGPVPGLGMLLVLGGVMSLPVVALAALNS